ncbi:MAG TPA: MFS transporter, partial [Candidatus Nitrosotenuis sp.]|nr:MFS transporter [Candidatus Nitrosotenuis sp.]
MSTPIPSNVVASPPGRGFWPLILTQLQGAFSDNAYKWLLTFMIMSFSLAQADRDRLVGVAGALFTVPFILFSMAGGWLADRFSKRDVAIGTKLLEFGIMLTATIGLLATNLPLLFSCLFLMGTQSALFSASKYGLLPELLPQKRLSWGNGVLELTTFVAIIAGTVTGGYLAEWFAGREAWAGGILLLLSALGFVAAIRIPPLPAADPARPLRINFLGDLFDQWKLIRSDRVLFLATLGNTYFWFLGALLQLGVIFLGTDILHLSQRETGLLSAAVAIGIGVGSLVAGYVSGNKIELGLIPLGALGMSVLGLLVARGGASTLATAAQLSLLGFFAGFFIVPVNALLQHRPDPDKKGGVLGAANLLSSFGLFAAVGVYYALQAWLRFNPLEIFLAASVLTIAATAYVLWLLPVALVRLVMIFVTHTIYRIRVEGRDNIPERGGALFVSNHLSFIDALLLAAS